MEILTKNPGDIFHLREESLKCLQLCDRSKDGFVEEKILKTFQLHKVENCFEQ